MTFLESIHSYSSIPLVQLMIALICGALVGWEREKHGKPAGIRTCALVCVGSTLFAILSNIIPPTSNLTGSPDFALRFDTGRMSAYIVQGIGFIGAGAILTYKNKVLGLTTAAIIWVVAGVGIAIAYNQLSLALTVTMLSLVILFVFGTLERKFLNRKRKKVRISVGATK